MNNTDLKEKLTRKMESGDFCYQRIFHSMPHLWYKYSEYMTKTKIYDFSEVFLLLITDWNNTQINKITKKHGKDKIDLAIEEIIYFYNTISNIYNKFNQEKELHMNDFEALLRIDLTNYTYIATLCSIYTQDKNFSKIISRKNNLIKKAKKTLNGVITFESFIKNEIIPQKEFLDIFVERLKMFNKNQFCAFMLCYDIKKTHKTKL